MVNRQTGEFDKQHAFIGSYEVKRLLGSGAFGEVYQAYQAFLDRQVAIKVLRAAMLKQESIQQQFMNEARTIARLRHPNIVSVYEFGLLPSEANEFTYMVMEYLPGETLHTRLIRDHLPVPETVRIFEQLAHGLDYAHTHNVIHRDLKPANILFSEQNEPVIVDFGLAKLLELSRVGEAPAFGVSQGFPEQTSSTGAGTPEYMSPEQVLGNPTSPRTDQYTLALIVYEMLVGRKPFDGPDFATHIIKRLDGPPPPPSSLVAEIPNTTDRVFNRALAVSPAERYAAVGDFARELGDALLPDRLHAPIQVVSDPVQAAALRTSRHTILFGLWGAVGITLLISLFCLTLFLRSFAAGAPSFLWDGLVMYQAGAHQYTVTGFWPGSAVQGAGVQLGDSTAFDLSTDYGDTSLLYSVNGVPRSDLPANWEPSINDSIQRTFIRDGRPAIVTYTIKRSSFELVILIAALVPSLTLIIGIVWLLLRWGAEPGLQFLVPIALASNLALLGVPMINLANGLIALALYILLPAFIQFVLRFPEPIRYLEHHPRQIWWLYVPVIFGIIQFLFGIPFASAGIDANTILFSIYGVLSVGTIIWKWGRHDLRRYPGLWGIIAFIVATNFASTAAIILFELDPNTIFSVFGNGANILILAYGSIFVGIFVGAICSTIGYHRVQRQLGPSLIMQESEGLNVNPA